MIIKTDFSHNKVLYSKNNDVHLVVSLEAPKIDWQKRRNAIAVVAVLDISGSMEGMKLAYAKQSMAKLVDNLQPGDFFGVVTFGDVACAVIPPQEITQTKKDEFKTAIGKIKTDGYTNLSGGMLKAFELGNQLDLPEGMVVRAIVFTDGHANKGIATKPDDILDLAKKSRNKVTVSAFGYGTDCNQEMLSNLAQHSDGSYAFIDSPEAALTAFAKELGGLLSVYAQNIEIEVVPSNDHRVIEVISDVDADQDDKRVKIRLDDILSEEKRNVVLRFNVKEQKQAFPRAVNVADVKITYSLLEDGKLITKTESIKTKIQFVKDGDQQNKPDATVDAVVGLAELAQKQIESENLAKTGNFAAAAQVMSVFAANAGSRGLIGLDNIGDKLAVHYSTAQNYSSSSGYRNTSKGMATRSYKLAYNPLEVEEDFFIPMRQAGTVSSNTAQAETVASFVGNDLSSVAGSINVATDLTTLGNLVSAAEEDKDPTPKTRSATKSRSKRW